MLAYTFSRLLTSRAVIERDMSQPDAYGADTQPDWQELSVVACAVWWDTSSSSGYSMNKTAVSPSRTVALGEGGMIMPAGTDITEKDRIARLLAYDPAAGSWETSVDGIIQITSVLSQGDHLEVYVERAHLGA